VSYIKESAASAFLASCLHIIVIPMGAQQSRSSLPSATEGHAHRFTRHLRRHSGLDKIFKSSKNEPTIDTNGSEGSSSSSSEGRSTLAATPVNGGLSQGTVRVGAASPATPASTAVSVAQILSKLITFSHPQVPAPAVQQSVPPMSPVTVPCSVRLFTIYQFTIQTTDE